MKKALTLLAILLLWPWWTLRACFLASVGVALLVCRAMVAEWGRG